MPFIEPFVTAILNILLNRARRSPSGLLLGHTEDLHGKTVQVRLPQERRAEHAVIVGKTGMGKTHVLLRLAWELMERQEPLVFVDYHGDATQALLALASSCPDGTRRLVLIDPTDRQRSPGFNPLAVNSDDDGDRFRCVSELSNILRQRWQMESFGVRTEELARNSFYVLAAHGLTLIELPALLTNTSLRQGLVGRLSNRDARSYWIERFEPLSDAMKAVVREPLLNKVTEFISVPAVRHLLGQRQSTVSFTEAFEHGRWVVINLSKGILRDHAHTVGNLLFAILQFEVMARINQPAGRRRLATLFCDEVQNLSENDLETLLTEGRKFGVSVITANQHWEQLPRTLRGALLATSTQIFFRLSATDARTLGPELSISTRRYVEALTELSRGEAFVRVGSKPPSKILIPSLPAVPTGPSVERLRTLSVTQWARARSDIEQDIQSRLQATHEQSPVSSPTSPRAAEPEGQHEW